MVKNEPQYKRPNSHKKLEHGNADLIGNRKYIAVVSVECGSYQTMVVVFEMVNLRDDDNELIHPLRGGDEFKNECIVNLSQRLGMNGNLGLEFIACDQWVISGFTVSRACTDCIVFRLSK